MEERLKQLIHQEQEKWTEYMVAQIIKVKEPLKEIISEQLHQSSEMKELKQTLLGFHNLLSEKNGYFLKQPTGTPQIQSRAGEIGLDFQSHELTILKRQVQENSCNLQKIKDDIEKKDSHWKSLLAQHSTKIEASEKKLSVDNEELKVEVVTLSQSSEKYVKQMKKSFQKRNNVLSERVKKLEEDVKLSLNVIDSTKINQNKATDLCEQNYEEVTTQLQKLSFLFESLDTQCTDLREKMYELQMDFLRLKNFQDVLSLSDDERLSRKDIIVFLAEIDSNYELMKTLLIQRVEGLETLRKHLAVCDRSVQQRQELSEKLKHLTACVENLQLLILTQDKSSTETCLEDFEKNWPKSPSLFDLSDLNVEHIGQQRD